MCCACSARACEVCACITHVRTCKCECTPDVHARKAYGPWRACVSIVCDIVDIVSACECECARAQFSCARVHMRVFELTRTCVVCVCAVLHCTVLVCTVLCNTGACACARGVCGACIARVMRARGASARVRGLAIPVAGNVWRGHWGSRRICAEEQRRELDVEDFEGFI